jgi:hypothetical protein
VGFTRCRVRNGGKLNKLLSVCNLLILTIPTEVASYSCGTQIGCFYEIRSLVTVRFQVLTAAGMRIAVSWFVALYSLVALRTESTGNSEASVSITRLYGASTQKTAVGPCQDESSPPLHTSQRTTHRYPEVMFSLEDFRAGCCIHFSCIPCMLHVLCLLKPVYCP